MKYVITLEQFITENTLVDGNVVWKHVKDITPNREDIPSGFKKDIVRRKFKNVDDFDMKSLLQSDPDFADYYKSGEERYDEYDVNPRDLSNEIVVVDGTLLDGYSRVATLLRNGESTTYAYVAEALISEGVYDPGILKAFFMAGGPGSGKSYVATELFDFPKGAVSSVSYATGLKLINNDNAFEKALKQAGYSPSELADYAKDPEVWDEVMIVRDHAKKLTKKMQQNYINQRLGQVIDGTGKDYKKIEHLRKVYQDLGYDTYMVFVNTSKKVALERNRMRERKLDDGMVAQMWQEVQDNLGKFQRLFGPNNTLIIDNSSYENKDVISLAEKEIERHLNTPVQNLLGKKWIQSQLEQKKRA